MSGSVGFIGIGNMGRPMSSNLGAAGFDVTVFDLNVDAARAHAGLLSVWMRRSLSSMEDGPAPRTPAAERLTAAFCALIERDFRLGKPMADYAAALGVTPTHLSRACRQVSGLTAAEMLTQRVLHAARDMLEGGDLPIRLIADMLGFSSAAYFTRFIQNQTARTPSALRQAARG